MSYSDRFLWALEQIAKSSDLRSVKGELARALADPGGNPKYANISNWLKSDTKPATPAHSTIVRFCHDRGLPIRADWLLYGKGSPLEPRLSSVPRVAIAQLAESARTIPILGWDTVRAIPQQRRTHGVLRLELIGSVEGWKDVYGLDASASAFAVHHTGDAMNDEIREGDLLIVDPERSPRSGNLVVATREDGAPIVRRLIDEAGTQYLVANNPRYQNVAIAGLEIIGVVIQMNRSFI